MTSVSVITDLGRTAKCTPSRLFVHPSFGERQSGAATVHDFEQICQATALVLRRPRGIKKFNSLLAEWRPSRGNSRHNFAV